MTRERRTRLGSTRNERAPVERENNDEPGRPEPTSGIVHRTRAGLESESRALAPDQRDTPELDLWADRTPAVPMVSASEGDRYADRICPLWHEPGLRQLRYIHRARLEPRKDGRDAASISTDRLRRPALPESVDEVRAGSRTSAVSGWLTRHNRKTSQSSQSERPTGNVARRRLLRVVGPLGVLVVGLTAIGIRNASQSSRDARVSETTQTERNAAVDDRALPTRREPVSPIAMAPVEATEVTSNAHPTELREPATQVGDVLAPPGEREAASGDALEASPPLATIRVRISAEPARARIWINDVHVPNPYDAELPRGERQRIVIRARGYATRDMTLFGEHSERLRVVLVKQPPHETASQR